MVSPVPIRMAVVSPDHDRRSSVHHRRRGDDHRRSHPKNRCRGDNGWWWGDDHRKSDAHRDPNSCMCRERCGKSYYPYNSDNGK